MDKKYKNLCKGETKAGEPCIAKGSKKDGYCYFHSPLYRQQMLKQTRTAAKKSHIAYVFGTKPVTSSADCYAFTLEGLTAIRQGRLTIEKGNILLDRIAKSGTFLMAVEKRLLIAQGIKDLV